jgi:hypothetical protein
MNVDRGGSRCTTEAVNVDTAEVCQNDNQYGTEGVAGNIRMDMITSSFATIILGLLIHEEHMIEQVGSLDGLRTLDSKNIICIILWLLAQKI